LSAYFKNILVLYHVRGGEEEEEREREMKPKFETEAE
jgi:hypothetical protein